MAPEAPHQPFIGPWRLTLKALRMAGLGVVSIVLLPLVPVLGSKRAPGVVRWWHGRLMRVLNIDVRLHGQLPDAPMLIAANHSTWLDIVILGHVFDTVFISKDEVDQWPIIGIYARAIGTLFLPRGAHKTEEIRRQTRATFAHGRSVVLFPEGTTHASIPPGRFHARLFSAALEGNHAVLPMALHYRDAETPAGNHHPLVPWVGIALTENFGNVFRLPRLQVDIHICPPIDSAGHNRRSLARASHDAISDRLSAPPDTQPE